MRTYEYAGDPFVEPRSHPWLAAAGDSKSQYYDLTATPARIRSSLEDFVPWRRFAAVESFYALLERLNHAKSTLESNDCAFTGPHENEDLTVSKALQCCGRVMVLFRDLEQNTDERRIKRLNDELLVELTQHDSAFRFGAVGTTQIPVRYLRLPESPAGRLGSQLMISFWAWGDDEADTMQNLARVVKNLARALRVISGN